MRHLIAAFLMLTLAACAPRLQPAGLETAQPVLLEDSWRADDGRNLPLKRWLPAAPRQPRAVLLALHGFNDYSNAFADPGTWWAGQQDIAVYAPDQRGFGRSPYTGYWSGSARMRQDVHQLTALLRARHPGIPVYWLGESMGGAVVLSALDHGGMPMPDGVILVAPAVWGRDTMPLLYRITLTVSSYTIPWMRFTGRNLGIQASDNIPMLRRLGADPLFIKETRVDAIHGLVNLMDEALASGPALAQGPPLLLLYGAKDEVIQKPPVERFASQLNGPRRIAVYDTGWHMLLRDLQGERVWRDIAAWIGNHDAALPSGRETTSLPLFPEGKKK